MNIWPSNPHKRTHASMSQLSSSVNISRSESAAEIKTHGWKTTIWSPHQHCSHPFSVLCWPKENISYLTLCSVFPRQQAATDSVNEWREFFHRFIERTNHPFFLLLDWYWFQLYSNQPKRPCVEMTWFLSWLNDEWIMSKNCNLVKWKLVITQ